MMKLIITITAVLLFVLSTVPATGQPSEEARFFAQAGAPAPGGAKPPMMPGAPGGLPMVPPAGANSPNPPAGSLPPQQPWNYWAPGAPGFGASHFTPPIQLELFPPLDRMTWETIEFQEKDGLIRVEMKGTSNLPPHAEEKTRIEVLLTDLLHDNHRGKLTLIQNEWLNKLSQNRHATFIMDENNQEGLEYVFEGLKAEGIGILRENSGDNYHWQIFIVQSIPSFLRAISQSLTITPGAPQPNLWGFAPPAAGMARTGANFETDYLKLLTMLSGKASPEVKQQIEKELRDNPLGAAYSPLMRAIMPGMFPGDMELGLTGEEAQKRTELERQCVELAGSFHKAVDEKEKQRIEKELDKALEESFDVRLEGYKRKIGELNSELSDLQAKLDTRISNKQAIIDKRKAQLLGEESNLEW